MDLAKEREFVECPPEGRHPIVVTAAELTISKGSGAEMIKLTGEILTKGFEGFTFYDYFITQGGAKGAGFAKRKLRGLIGDVVDNPNGVPDEQVAGMLLGRRCYADFLHDQMMDKDENGEYTKPRWDTDPKTGQKVPVNSMKPTRYYSTPVGGHEVHQPAGEQKTQTQAAPAKPGIIIDESTTPDAPKAANGAAPAASGEATPPWAKGGVKNTRKAAAAPK